MSVFPVMDFNGYANPYQFSLQQQQQVGFSSPSFVPFNVSAQQQQQVNFTALPFGMELSAQANNNINMTPAFPPATYCPPTPPTVTAFQSQGFMPYPGNSPTPFQQQCVPQYVPQSPVWNAPLWNPPVNPFSQTQFFQFPNGNGFQTQFFIPTPQQPVQPAPVFQQAQVWGDPHFVGFEGDKYDVQGQAGKTYNILSDKGFQYNAKFIDWKGGKEGATVIGEAGLTVGDNQISFDANKKRPTLNGKKLKKGKTYDLGNGSTVTWTGKNLEVKTPEYEVTLKDQGDHLDQDVKIGKNGVAMDGVMPHGLLGQTADGDGKARKGDEGAGAQGGGAIEGANGITRAGDTDAVKLYEVGNIFDTSFGGKFNRFDSPANTQPRFLGVGQQALAA